MACTIAEVCVARGQLIVAGESTTRKGKPINMAATLELDAVIDPAETRRWLAAGLASARCTDAASRGIDPW